jgi:iron complex transport system substrate-binding protein
VTTNDHNHLRIISLIPSATEIVAALGLTDRLVGRSHECDYPVSVQALPVCTAPKFNPEGASGEIHDRVTQLLQTALSVYEVKTDVLEQLQPTHILTQAQCEVCAVSLADVEQAVMALTQTQVEVISLQPNVLSDLWADIEHMGQALGIEVETLLAELKQRVETIAQTTQDISEADRPTVACIEWADPLMAAGNWIPELVQLAGGKSVFGTVGQHSPWLEWEALVEADPDVIILMPCGFDLDRTQKDLDQLTQHPQWTTLSAVQAGHVYITDGNHYFNRPGPRLVDSLEILAEILYPNQFEYGYQGKGWKKASPQ